MLLCPFLAPSLSSISNSDKPWELVSLSGGSRLSRPRDGQDCLPANGRRKPENRLLFWVWAQYRKRTKMEQKGEGRERVCVRDGDCSWPVASAQPVQRASPPSPLTHGPAPNALRRLQPPHFHVLAPSQTPVVPSSRNPRGPSGQSWEIRLLPPTPQVHLYPVSGVGPRALLGTLAHTEGSEGLEVPEARHARRMMRPGRRRDQLVLESRGGLLLLMT